MSWRQRRHENVPASGPARSCSICKDHMMLIKVETLPVGQSSDGQTRGEVDFDRSIYACEQCDMSPAAQSGGTPGE